MLIDSKKAFLVPPKSSSGRRHNLHQRITPAAPRLHGPGLPSRHGDATESPSEWQVPVQGGSGDGARMTRRPCSAGGRPARDRRRGVPAGTIAAYAAAAAAFGYAAVSLYWRRGRDPAARHPRRNPGGHRPPQQTTFRRVGPDRHRAEGGRRHSDACAGPPVGRIVRRKWLLTVAGIASAVLICYGAVQMGPGRWCCPARCIRAARSTMRRCAGTLPSGTCGSWSGGCCSRSRPWPTGGTNHHRRHRRPRLLPRGDSTFPGAARHAILDPLRHR